MLLKVLTINIWRYYDWEKRKAELIRFLSEQRADIVFLQEAAYDDRLKEKYAHQIDEIDRELGYKYFALEKEAEMTKWHKEPIDWKMYYGLGILSRYPLKSIEMHILPHVERDKDFGFLHLKLETTDGEMDIINVHLENTDKGSEEHLKTLLEWCREKNILPIIAGDFNMIKTDTLIKLADKDFYISYKIKKYFSFMPTAFSYNKVPVTLDYILAHKSKFIIESVECLKTPASDHFPVVAKIRVK